MICAALRDKSFPLGMINLDDTELSFRVLFKEFASFLIYTDSFLVLSPRILIPKTILLTVSDSD